ncbi:unnamed protein product [Cuscuta europaea]|uniref:Protein FAR1-RELATED SEQUENCE n=1 Tax=Cuscuta europaea TaxID=41803 RepID=A0A9P0ZHU5_CUSEU|nr:unnamed protein product [Cuscuta europaea]
MNLEDGEFKRISDLTPDEIRALQFGSEDEAYEFYSKYAKCHGFVVREHSVRRNKSNKLVTRHFVCNRQGLRNPKHLTRSDRKRGHRPLTRTNCDAKFHIRYKAKDSCWIVTCFQETHNHELTPSKYVHLLSAYRGMTDADKAQVDSLHSQGIRTCHIMGYMVAQKGGYNNVGFTKKDLYNYFDSKMCGDIKDGDVIAALSYLHGKADNDPMLYAKFSTTDDGRLRRIFWADGKSRSDFACFGDVLAFDTTYKKNKYNYPLVIFSGCNHHLQTSIFGCALVSDETTETYKWVLESFLEAMGNKHPNAVVTDSDGAMREAIKHVFPSAFHRLCAWHLHKNACENVKIPLFLKDFKTVMYANFTRDRFETFWKDMVVQHGLEGNSWVLKTYNNRFCKVAAKTSGLYNDVMDDILHLTEKYEMLEKKKLADPIGTEGSLVNHIGDPNMVKTKGAPKKNKSSMKRVRHCSNCGSTKHNARTCRNEKRKHENAFSHSDGSEFSTRSDHVSMLKKDGSRDCKSKKAKGSSQDLEKDGMIKGVCSSDGGHPILSHTQPMFQPKQPQIYEHGSSSQANLNFLNYAGVPFYPHNVQSVMVPPEVPIYPFNTQSGVNKSSSCLELLQQVIKNNGAHKSTP